MANRFAVGGGVGWAVDPPEASSMRSARIFLIALMLLDAGCTNRLADNRTPGACRAGGATPCQDMFEQNKGGQNNGGGMGRGMG
jgi:hypothetical protein